jgi:thioredoxin-related protein
MINKKAMRKKATILILIMAFAIALARAQETGIQFIQNLNWAQVLQKAKAEHKYIFVDCYATWCVPCKWMDANVYNKSNVGEVYNKDFLAIRLQMDKTKADNDRIKKWYGIAGMMESNYHVNAYPTFLFFDPDGKPVHKVTGSLDAVAFIQLAKDAQNPDKQYYAILQNFQANKLDTAEEKGLARSFRSSDKALAGKIAADYLGRIPEEQLAFKDNQILILQFQDTPAVLAVALNYLEQLPKDQFSAKGNLDFLRDLSKQPTAKALAIAYIGELNTKELGEKDNLLFAGHFADEPQVQEIAQNYIAHMNEEERYTELNLTFASWFTKKPMNKGFDVFYYHAAKVDAVMKDNDFAQYQVSEVIKHAEFTPLFNAAKENRIKPNFDSIENVITQKYNGEFADRVMINSKLDWYSYLARDKKMAQYWPDYITARIAQVQKFRYDTTATLATSVNGICWEIFEHGSDKMQLDTVAGWMKNLAELNAHSPFLYAYLDTYANLLYKAGKTQEALTWEKKAASLAPKAKDIQANYDKMQAGQPTWAEGGM